MVHTDGRRRGKSRPRILYWFRTPPGVRIGRSALDESAIRLIEEYNPDVEFDWTRILKGQESPVDQKPAPQDRRGRSRPREYPRPAPTAPSRVPPAAPQIGAEGEQALATPSDALTASDAPAPALPLEPGPVGTTEDADTLPPAEEHALEAPTVLDEAAIDELLSDAAPRAEHAPGASEGATPAQARLGSEGLSRLRARHAEVLARISETVADQARRDELKSQAERLNPDTWVTDAEVTEGLEQYETVFESLRTVVGRRRKRRRRSRPHGGSATPAGAAQSASSPDSAGGEEDDGDDTGGEL